jgi:hypothetical protein
MLATTALRTNSVHAPPDSRLPASQASRSLSLALLVATVLIGSGSLRAAEPISKPTNSRAARDDAAASIPMDRLSREMRPRVQNVVNNPSIFRRLPIERIDCDPDLYLFLVRNPEVVVNIWQIMGITGMTLDRIGPDRFRASDGQGTTGVAEFVYHTPELQVIYADGIYDGPMAPVKLRGQCVLVLKMNYNRQANGHAAVTSRLDAFLHLDNIGVEWIARTLQPLVGKTADRNFGEASSFLMTLSHTAETNPAGVARLIRKLNRVDAPTKQRLIELTAQAAERADAAESVYSDAAAARAVGADTAAARLQRTEAISLPR